MNAYQIIESENAPAPVVTVEQPVTKSFLGDLTGLIIVGAFMYLFLPLLKTVAGNLNTRLKPRG